MSWWRRLFGMPNKQNPTDTPPALSSNTDLGQTSRATWQETLPQAPEGYSWQLAGQSQAFFLRPEGWHFKAFEQAEDLAYFITREPIPPDAKPGSYQFETGFTINVFRGVTRAKGIAPSGFALGYVQVVTQSAEHETEDTWQNRGGPFIGYGVQFCSGSDIGRLRQQHHLIANDETDTLYLIIFETPERLWERDWPLAKVVIERLMLHPDV
jgi:hypothetical protein